MATWNVADPSYSYATANLPTNILGYSGAAFADIVMQFLGLASVVSMLPIVAWALTLISGRRFSRIPARIGAWFAGSVLSSAVIGCFSAAAHLADSNGIGGVVGDMILRFPALFVGAYPRHLRHDRRLHLCRADRLDDALCIRPRRPQRRRRRDRGGLR
ncbi:DNA translocase FtsK 4TM domain-containing protein [Rhizobium beringeri]